MDVIWYDEAVRGLVGILVLGVLQTCHNLWTGAQDPDRTNREGGRRNDSDTGLD